MRTKYKTYIKGYKEIYGLTKPIYAYIILSGGLEIGYIQYYNAYDFPRSAPLKDLPQSMAAIDIFIGEKEYLGKNIAPKAIIKFLDEYVFKQFDYAFVDPEATNEKAVKAYTKSGFKVVNQVGDDLWMLVVKGR